MPRKLALSQIIRECARFKSDKDKVEYLLAHESEPLKIILSYAHDAKWALPEGLVPYRPFSEIDSEGRLYPEARRLYIFVEQGGVNMIPSKRQYQYIQLLESIHPEDAKLLLDMKEGKFPKAINRKIVNLAFPGLVREEDEQK